MLAARSGWIARAVRRRTGWPSAAAASAEAGFEIKAGTPTEVFVVLNAGLLAVTAPGGDQLELLGSEKDIYGKQKSVAYNYGESWQVTVPAGEYVLRVRKSDGAETMTSRPQRPTQSIWRWPCMTMARRAIRCT